MKYILKNFFKSLFILSFITFSLAVFTSCTNYSYVKILSDDELTLEINESTELKVKISNDLDINNAMWQSNNDCVEINQEGIATAKSVGKAKIIYQLDAYSDSIIIEVIDSSKPKLSLEVNETEIEINSTISLETTYFDGKNNIKINSSDCEYIFTSGSNLVTRNGSSLKALKEGEVKLYSTYNNLISNTITITIYKNNYVTKISLKVNKDNLQFNETTTIDLEVAPSNYTGSIEYEILEGQDIISITENVVKAKSKEGTAKIIAKSGDVKSNEIIINVKPNKVLPTSIILYANKDYCNQYEEIILNYQIMPENCNLEIEYIITKGSQYAEINQNKLKVLEEKEIRIKAVIGNIYSNEIIINKESINSDPYENVSKEEFYKNYKPASSLLDSTYRTKHSLMSGSIEDQDQEPSISSNRPKQKELFIRNTSKIYSDNGNTYSVVNSNGDIVLKVYKGGAYVTLEEVAAYVLAFGETPANYSDSKSGAPSNSVWGKFLRLNNSLFSGNTKSYPFEPVLPNISGCGGDLDYYEIDLGTTGTDCDDRYPSKVYNDGKKITRGAARIIYTRYDKNHDEIIDLNEKFLFYTYNHYNDFQEYLNYYGGWGEMFGNITGGGKISSKTDYNPTEYVKVFMKDLTTNEIYIVANNYFVVPNYYKDYEFMQIV